MFISFIFNSSAFGTTPSAPTIIGTALDCLNKGIVYLIVLFFLGQPLVCLAQVVCRILLVPSFRFYMTVWIFSRRSVWKTTSRKYSQIFKTIFKILINKAISIFFFLIQIFFLIRSVKCKQSSHFFFTHLYLP